MDKEVLERELKELVNNWNAEKKRMHLYASEVNIDAELIEETFKLKNHDNNIKTYIFQNEENHIKSFNPARKNGFSRAK